MGVVAGEGHLGFEVAAIVHGVLVQYDERNAPFEDVLIDELRGRLAGCSAIQRRHREGSPLGRRSGTHLNVGPLLLVQVLELLHKDPLRCVRHGDSSDRDTAFGLTR